MRKSLKIHENDNVAVALTDLSKGEEVELDGNHYYMKESIPAKHKYALKDFEVGEEIRMYNVVAGAATINIPIGYPITTQNVTHRSESFTSTRKSDMQWQAPNTSKFTDRHFMGYHREDGQVGTANYWLVFPLVFCENRNIETLKKAFRKALGFEKPDPYESLIRSLLSENDNGNVSAKEATTHTTYKPVFENIDGIQFLTHQGGCGGTREDAQVLCQLLSGYINNPNVAGATVLSLGCQNAQIEMFKSALDRVNPDLTKPVYILEQQESGTENELITQAIKKTIDGLKEANEQTRKPAPLSKLTIGLECGGSDGFSGISANPSIGHTSDLVVALGGKAILSEFPELCGVEQELINRMQDDDNAQKFVEIMRAYDRAAVEAGSGFDMNPSPGNIKDGLITDAMKSAGAAKKGGTSPVTDVLDYTEYATKAGLNLLCTPGNDVESTTGLAGSGANIILFTTGLGTPTGNPVVPVLKLSSNSRLAKKMPDIIDIDTGAVISGQVTIEEMGEQILDYIIEVASGNRKSKAMELEQYDFIPWKRGVSL